MASADTPLPRQLTYVAVDEIPPDPDNEKDHDEAGIMQSIRTLGFIEVPTIDERTGLLLSGHGRRDALIAMRDAGEEAPEGVVVADGVWLAPVVKWRSVDDDHAAAARVALNNLVMRGGWKPDALVLTLQRLDQSATPGLLQTTGHSDAELNDLLARLGEPPTLAQLSQQHGESKAEDFWPSVRFTIPPELKARYEHLVDGIDGDRARFEFLVTRAELASEPSVALFIGEST